MRWGEIRKWDSAGFQKGFSESELRFTHILSPFHSLCLQGCASARCLLAPRQHIVHSAERGSGTYIRERQRRGGARGEERGCPNALTGLPACDIKLRSNGERAWRRTGRGKGGSCRLPGSFDPSQPHKLLRFLRALPKHKGEDSSLLFSGIP